MMCLKRMPRALLAATLLYMPLLAQAAYDAPLATVSTSEQASQMTSIDVGTYTLLAWGRRPALAGSIDGQLLRRSTGEPIGSELELAGRTLVDTDGNATERMTQPRLLPVDRDGDGVIDTDAALLVFGALYEYDPLGSPNHELVARHVIVDGSGNVSLSPAWRLTYSGDRHLSRVWLDTTDFDVARNQQDGGYMLIWSGTRYDPDTDGLVSGVWVSSLDSGGHPLGDLRRFDYPAQNYMRVGWPRLHYDPLHGRFIATMTEFAANSSLWGATVAVDPSVPIPAATEMITGIAPSSSSMARIWHHDVFLPDHERMPDDRILVLHSNKLETYLGICWFDRDLQPLGSCDEIASRVEGLSGMMRLPSLLPVPGTNAALLRYSLPYFAEIHEMVIDLESTPGALLHSADSVVAHSGIASYPEVFYQINGAVFTGGADEFGSAWLYSQADGNGGYGVNVRYRNIMSSADLSVSSSDAGATAGDPVSMDVLVSVGATSGEVPSLAQAIQPRVTIDLPTGLVVASASGCDWDAASATCSLDGSVASGDTVSLGIELDSSALAGIGSDTNLPVTFSVYSDVSDDPNLSGNSATATVSLSVATSSSLPLARIAVERRARACDIPQHQRRPAFCD